MSPPTDPADQPASDPSAATPADANDDLAFDPATVATLEALDEVLDELREHDDSVPQWEFCEGFLTALLCTRREVPEAEWLPALLGGDPDGADALAPFASAGQRTRFLMHWLQREAQIRTALQAPVQDLSDPDALEPATLDWRGMLHAVAQEDDEAHGDGDSRADAPPGEAPSYAQMWAMGFLGAVDVWDEDWAPPRDREIAEAMRDALECIALLAEEDRAPAAFNLFDDQAPPSVSEQRLNDFGEALWAVYDLYAIAASLGPRVAPAQSSKVGRNDPCPCGSGQKYKKCCGG